MDLLTQDLSGWRMAGKGGFRWAASGILESHGGSGLLWYAAQAFDDCVIEVSWRLSARTDNSGVFLRVPPLADDIGPAIERGYEIQIDDRGVDRPGNRMDSPLHLTGAVYRLAPARRLASRPVGSWNEFRITAQGPTIAVELNGEEVSRLENGSRERAGHVALQCHHEGSRVRFRDLRVTPLKFT